MVSDFKIESILPFDFEKNITFTDLDLFVATPMIHNNRKKKYKFNEPHGDCI